MCTGFCSPSNGFEVVVACSGASPQILESEEEKTIQLYSIGLIVLHIYIHTSKKRNRISEAALMDPLFSLSTNDGSTVKVQHDHRKNLLVTHTLQLICA